MSDFLRVTSVFICLFGMIASTAAADRVRTDSGTVEGTKSADGKIQIFKGIPYAAPPIGPLRWKEPQPVRPWDGVRKTADFSAHCTQGRVFGDMAITDAGPSEDCLYLNVWTPNLKPAKKLPVMVWIYGGGFQAGSSSEGRQNGEFLAHRDVVVVSMNYRLGIFGFFSHPELTKESPHHASGNYGLMDQAAALQWVRKNIANFGGDPDNVTIFGESAGSFSVSALMASPTSRSLMHRAIGESGAFFGATLHAQPVAVTEQDGQKFAEEIGAPSLEKLRALPAQQLLDRVMKGDPFRFGPNIDGYFLPATPAEIYAKGQQAHVPLLAGWNRDEGSYQQFFGKDAPSKENYVAKVGEQFGDQTPEILKLFPADTDEQMKQSSGRLSTATFIGFGTWRWMEMQKKTGDAVVYRYQFDQALPVEPGSPSVNMAYHSAEIEFVFGALDSKKLQWRPEDYKLSEQIGTCWTNFAKTGNPNGEGLPQWPEYKPDEFQVMHLSATSQAKPDDQREAYLALEKPQTAQQVDGTGRAK